VGSCFKDIKKASAVLTGAERRAVELVFFMSLKQEPTKGRPSLNRRFRRKKSNPSKENFTHAAAVFLLSSRAGRGPVGHKNAVP